MVKSPLRYPGGKSKAMKFLKFFIPEFIELREPFFGGGSFTFYCLNNFKNKTYLASDLNYELFCFWKELKSNPDELINRIQNIYNNKSDGKALFNHLLNKRDSNVTSLERAIDFFVLNRITFSGVVDSGGFSQGSFDNRFTQSSIERLVDASKLIEKVNFYCDDYSELLNREGKNVFIFLDPPYFSATKSKLYGKNGILHTSFNHSKLFSDLKNCKHQWLITYDDSEYIRDLYKEYFQHQWQLQYGMNNYKQDFASKGNELLIANYDITKYVNKFTSKQDTLF